MLTADEAVKELNSALKETERPSIFDKVIPAAVEKAISIGEENKDKIQNLLNKLLEKNGILTPDEEKYVVDVLNAQKAEKERNRVRRTKAAVIIIGATLLVIAGTIVIVNREKK